MSAACGALIASLPACKVLVIASSISFAGAIGLYVIAVCALRRARMRRLAGDPYRYPFGDDPAAFRRHGANLAAADWRLGADTRMDSEP